MSNEFARVTLEFEKETKNTIRYSEQAKTGSPPIVNTLYIQKWALSDQPPRRITMILEETS